MNLRSAILSGHRRGVTDTWDILLRQIAKARAAGMSLADFEDVAKKVHADVLESLKRLGI